MEMSTWSSRVNTGCNESMIHMKPFFLCYGNHSARYSSEFAILRFDHVFAVKARDQVPWWIKNHTKGAPANANNATLHNIYKHCKVYLRSSAPHWTCINAFCVYVCSYMLICARTAVVEVEKGVIVRQFFEEALLTLLFVFEKWSKMHW